MNTWLRLLLIFNEYGLWSRSSLIIFQFDSVGQHVLPLHYRLLLANAVRSGKVTMTLRRKKKRPAPPPPTNQTTPGKSAADLEKENKSIMTQSLDSLPGNSESHDNWYLGNRENGSSLTLDSMGSFGNDMGSTDDVFMDNSHFDSQPVLQHPMSDGAISQISRSDYVNVSIGSSRTHSASVIDDVVEWNTEPINFTQDVLDTVNTAQMTLQKRGKTGTLKHSAEQDASMYSSDPELISINTSRHLYKKNKKGWRYHQDRGGTQTPTSCYSSDSGSSCHVPKVRITLTHSINIMINSVLIRTKAQLIYMYI